MVESLPRIASRPSRARLPCHLHCGHKSAMTNSKQFRAPPSCYLSLSELCLFPFLSKRLGLFVAGYGSDVNGMGRRQNGKNTSFTQIFMPFWRGTPPFTEDSCDKKSAGAEKEKEINERLLGILLCFYSREKRRAFSYFSVF